MPIDVIFSRWVHVISACLAIILLLLLSGIYNTYLAWDKYNLDKAVLHALWGTHILLAALVFTISLYVLAGPQPPKAHRRLMAINFVLLLCAVAAASSLKWARERAVAEHAASIHPAENQ
jgi:predicted ABC-type exoprotein transport system permease subunit